MLGRVCVRVGVGRCLSTLPSVGSILAVSSCKGGVGKSTVAVNLAHSLAATGASVGLFDADVYGPSLPTMVAAEDARVHRVGDLVAPVLTPAGIKCMSYGFVQQAAAVMRGPMVSRVVQQLLTTTDWGALDVLVVDMPPGTGDILITLGQQIPFTGSVMVTTPQKLSYVDVVKGIDTFGSLKIPTLAIVENMAYFTCEHGSRYEIFGKGHADKLAETYGIRHTVSLPLDPAVSAGGDAGQPLVVSEPDSEVGRLYAGLASSVLAELEALGSRAASETTFVVRWDSRRGCLLLRMMTESGAQEALLPAPYVRSRCRCAQCVDELTGEVVLDPCSVDPSVQPVKVTPTGNYAVSITWSDGHNTSIYPYEQLKGMAGELGLL